MNALGSRWIWPRASLALIAAALALAACERSEPEADSPPASGISGDADPADARVIDEWARALSAGDLDAAAAYFAIPSVAENGPALIEIRNRAEARLFNASLPCGARLTRAVSEGPFVVATFLLGERPGPGSCGEGTGAEAQTAFVIEGGEIVEWRRVATGGEGESGRSV